MQAEQVTGLLRAAAAGLREGAAAIAPAFEEEVIHEFRVETKRLRAFLRLLQTANPDLGFKLGKRFRAVYAAAGTVRDGQMHLTAALRACHKALLGYALWTATGIGRSMKEWEEAYRPKIFTRLIEKVETTTWPALSLETVRRFYDDRVTAIDGLLRRMPIGDEDIHTVRKSVKDLQHTTRLLKAEWPEALEALKDFPLDRLDELGRKAGDFNDHRNALDALERYLATGRPEKEAAALEPVRVGWLETADRDRAELLEDIQRFKDDAQAGADGGPRAESGEGEA